MKIIYSKIDKKSIIPHSNLSCEKTNDSDFFINIKSNEIHWEIDKKFNSSDIENQLKDNIEYFISKDNIEDFSIRNMIHTIKIIKNYKRIDEFFEEIVENN